MSKKLIAAAGILILITAAYFGASRVAANMAEKRIEEALAKVSGVMDVEYKQVSVDLLRRDVSISDVLVSTSPGAKTKIAEIVIRDIDEKSEVPAFLSLSCRGIEVKLAQMKDDGRKFRELGYPETLLCNLDIDYRYDREKKEMIFNRIAVGAKDAGEVDLSLHVGNVNLDPKEAVGLLFTYPKIMFHDARIRYRDESLIQRIVDLKAREENTSSQAIKTALAQTLEQSFDQTKDEFTRRVLAEVKRFIDNPRAFSVSMAPDKPQPLGRLLRVKDPQELVKLLKVEIKS